MWANVGVAPLYNRYPLVIRLAGREGAATLRSGQDVREWLPDRDIWWEERFRLPDDLPEGEYRVELGIETGVAEIGNVRLAIEGWDDGYYPMGTVRIERRASAE